MMAVWKRLGVECVEAVLGSGEQQLVPSNMTRFVIVFSGASLHVPVEGKSLQCVNTDQKKKGLSTTDNTGVEEKPIFKKSWSYCCAFASHVCHKDVESLSDDN